MVRPSWSKAQTSLFAHFSPKYSSQMRRHFSRTSLQPTSTTKSQTGQKHCEVRTPRPSRHTSRSTFSTLSPRSSDSYSNPPPPPDASNPAPPSSPKLTHLTPTTSEVQMVSITSKPITSRTATAVSTITFSNPSPFQLITTHSLQKGDVLAVARVAGIMAAKKCAELIPLAHPGLGLTGVSVEVDLVPPDVNGSSPTTTVEKERENADPGSLKGEEENNQFGRVDITATVSCEDKTGVEMEALTAAMVAGLTVYDMCKGADRGMVLGNGRVIRKEGGRSGSWRLEKGGLVRDDGDVGKGEGA